MEQVITPEYDNDSISSSALEFEGRSNNNHQDVTEDRSHDSNSTVAVDDVETEGSSSLFAELKSAEGFHPMASKIKGGGKSMAKLP